MSAESARVETAVPTHLAELVRRAAAAAPAKPALLHHDSTVTWAGLDADVDAAAHALTGLGLRAGDRVAVQLGNEPAFVVAYLGALRAGLVAVPVNTSYTRGETAHLVADSGARVLLTSRSGLAAAQVLAVEIDVLEHVVVTGSAAPPAGVDGWEGLLEAARPAGAHPAVGGGEDLALLLYTSGTSGRPKGAMLTHRALLANLEQGSRIEPPVATSESVVLLVLPLTHVYGLSGLGSVLWNGATGVLVDRFDPTDTLAVVRRTGVTTVLGAPPMYVAWSMIPDVDDAFAGVQLCLSGAAPLPSAVLGRVLETTGQHVFEGYGLTETAPALTSTLMSEVAKPDSIGRAIPGVELRLRDDSGAPALDGDPGEIVVRGPNLFSGYWPDGSDGPDAEGWWPTGDVAYLDSDGDLHLVDRRRELILVSGFNVYPREVEQALASHPGVEEVAVLGIPHPYTGESVKALVVPSLGVRPTADELIEHASRTLARFKCPSSVEFVETLPHSATGKVSKGRLREAGLGDR